MRTVYSGCSVNEVIQNKSETMNVYQVMGIIVCCTVVFAGVVTFLTMQGVHILLALSGVYLAVVWCMLSMQRKARDSFDHRDEFGRRRFDSDPQTHRARARDFSSGRGVVSIVQD